MRAAVELAASPPVSVGCQERQSALSVMRRWMEKQYGHHVAASLPAESDTGASAKAIMDEGALPAYTLEQVRGIPCCFARGAQHRRTLQSTPCEVPYSHALPLDVPSIKPSHRLRWRSELHAPTQRGTKKYGTV